VLDKLTELFRQFPGVGPRQARRFAYFLLSRNGAFREALAAEIASLKDKVKYCSACGRLFVMARPERAIICSICADSSRSAATLMVVEKDVDLEAVERANVYKGRYFVLGGTMPLNGDKTAVNERADQLLNSTAERVSKNGLEEIILALSTTPEGEYTAARIAEKLKTANLDGLKITKLGRGLSSGLELEYSDTDTLKNALEGRK
jgi:recombination protein RecR